MRSPPLAMLLSVMSVWGSVQVRRPDVAVPNAAVLEGKVRDSSGTALSNFTIVATRQGSKEQFGGASNEKGEFQIEGILPGTYDVLIRREGFGGELRMTNVALDPNARKSITAEIAVANSPPGGPIRRPGEPIPAAAADPEPLKPDSIPDPNALRRPEVGDPITPIFAARLDMADFIDIPNRWDIMLPAWVRYPEGPKDTPFRPGGGPYRQSRIKGDYPIFGKRWFLALTATSNTLAEARRLPVPSPASSENAGTPGFFGRGAQFQGTQNLVLSADFFHGLTSFRPVDFRIKVTPTVNGTYLGTRETGAVNINVADRHTRLDYQYAGIQEAFTEVRLKATSANFDFISVRAGTQAFNSDFRGFIFFDNEPGVRVFGTLKANRVQYNAAYFYMMEKDTNSQLNTTHRRDQEVLVGNVFIQDFIKPGYTTQFSVHYNREKPSFHIDKNGFLVRPAPVGTVIPKSINAIYAGWAGDGHLGRMNLSHAVYQVLGRERPNPISGDVFGPLTGRINAQMAALEVSFDQDWKRYRFAAYYASGDNNPSDNQSRGFDTILDNVQFAGSDISFWNRQGIRLTGTELGLNQRFSLHPALRTSKEEGQANFVNPGLYLLNAGMDAELTPKLRASVNMNLLSFAHTQVLETLLFQSHIQRNIGVDTGLGFRWRPFLSNNVIVKFGGAALIPAAGFRQIYTSQTLFSTFAELKLTY